ncbi:MAG: hypothetical protein K2X65_03415 [Burkholderiaceae bacterium]|nr:hypothetical protein [Burkholderiaceae bacterium]
MSGYNFIYKKLVQGPDDVVGALAYALYKEEKIAYVIEFQADRQRAPEDADLQEFHRMTNVPQRIEAYKQQAERLLQEFLDDALVLVLQERTLQMHQEFMAQQVSAISTQIESKSQELHQAITHENRFWSGVQQNVVAGVVTTLMAFGFVLAAWMWAEGPDKILSGAWNKYSSTEQPTQPTPKP